LAERLKAEVSPGNSGLVTLSGQELKAVGITRIWYGSESVTAAVIPDMPVDAVIGSDVVKRFKTLTLSYGEDGAKVSLAASTMKLAQPTAALPKQFTVKALPRGEEEIDMPCAVLRKRVSVAAKDKGFFWEVEWKWREGRPPEPNTKAVNYSIASLTDAQRDQYYFEVDSWVSHGFVEKVPKTFLNKQG
jgi:hypothetical protein